MLSGICQKNKKVRLASFCPLASAQHNPNQTKNQPKSIVNPQNYKTHSPLWLCTRFEPLPLEQNPNPTRITTHSIKTLSWLSLGSNPRPTIPKIKLKLYLFQVNSTLIKPHCMYIFMAQMIDLKLPKGGVISGKIQKHQGVFALARSNTRRKKGKKNKLGLSSFLP